MERHEYDSPWKEILSDYFQEFMAFFFPEVGREIDWTKGYELLDKELRQITREAEIGKRTADLVGQGVDQSRRRDLGADSCGSASTASKRIPAADVCVQLPDI